MDTADSAQVGDRVSFRIADVFLPEPAEVIANLKDVLEVNGVVVEFSDSGNNLRAFAVVRITTQQTVVLPVSALRVMPCG
jgi:tRNA A58 N-methylase Trm61